MDTPEQRTRTIMGYSLRERSSKVKVKDIDKKYIDRMAACIDDGEAFCGVGMEVFKKYGVS